ncbi:MAG: NAD-dependent epimerase/dehydratase family protein [Planctomycetota bacterium]|nr:NAD-dependent epimerase/dehydratase family protein [Planctomycetota bacterium]
MGSASTDKCLNLKGCRVLVTGGAGFLGSHVIDALKTHGVSEVVCPTRSECDLRNPSAVQDFFDRAKPQWVLHLAAAQGGVAWQKANQATAYLDNARMMESIVTASLSSGVERLLFTASSICYPRGADIPYREDTLWEGPPEPAHWGYAQAKRGGIALLQAVHDQHGLSTCVVMPANMYGPRARFDPERSNVVAATIRRCLEARDRGDDSITCWGSGTPIREFLYVEDAAEGIIRAAERCSEPDPVNLGTGVETTIAELVETVAAAVGFTGTIQWDRDRPDGAARVCMAVDRMQEVLDWTPGTSLLEGLQRTISWWESARLQEADA